METLQKDLSLLFAPPKPFETTLPWAEYEFSRRFYDVVNYWGIPTKQEISFIESYLKKPASRILDMACGGGRHAIGLAEKGHKVTAVDIGSFPLEKAKKEASEKKLQVNFICRDITEIEYDRDYDLAFLICGQLGHFSPEENRVIFQKASNALIKGGIFLIHLWSFNNDDRANFTHWYREKRPLYLKHPSVVHREQFYFDNERVKLIRDFAIDTVTRENRLFSVSEKEYTTHEIRDFAQAGSLDIIAEFGDFEGSQLDKKSNSRIFILKKQ